MRYSLIFLFLAGCASTPPQVVTVEKAVVIPGAPVFLPIPSELLTGCVAPGPVGTTNGELLLYAHSEAVYAACLSDHLDAVGKLK